PHAPLSASWKSGDSLLNSLHYLLNSIHQQRQVMVNGVPDDLQIDTEIFVRQQVAEILDILPGCVFISSLQLHRQFTHRFADYLELADNSRVAHAVLHKLIEGYPLDIRLNG